MEKELKNPKDVDIKQTGLKLKFKTDGVVASLIRSYADWLKKKPSEATFAEWAKAISFTTDKHQQAFNLVSLSLMKAIEYQLGQRLEDIDPDDDGNGEFLKTRIRYEVFAKLNEKEYSFDCNHLSNPAAMPLMADFKPAYQQWLIDSFQMAATQAADFASDFPDYFAYEFSILLNSQKSDFQNLLDWCQNPFNEQAQQMLARKKYKAELKKKYHQPALGEKLVALSDVYIEPGFLVFEKALPKERLEELRSDKKYPQQGPFYKTNYPGSIHNYLLQHFIPKSQSKELGSERETGKLMVVLGHPGHGKSSFCYRSIHDLLKDPNFNGNAFFLRLQDAKKTILDADIEELVRLLPENQAIGFADLLDNKHGQTNLLFLDGLDEFCMAQSPSDDEVRQFLRNCKTLVDRNPHLYIIVTSRLSYVEPHKLHQEECLVLKLDVLNVEQQKNFVQNFMANWQDDGCTITEVQIENINKKESQKHIRELIELPILLQMVLMAKVPLEATASRATIYDQLFDQVLQRKWDDNKRLKKYVKEDSGFTKDDLREYLAFLAFKTFQGKKGYLRKSEIAKYPKTIQFAKDFLRTYEDGQSMKQVLKDILTSFYLQESQKEPGDQPEADKEYNYVIEFMHKSLYEYLACEHIWQNTLDFFLETDKRYKVKTRSLEEVQRQMQESYATIRHTSETVEYMKEIIDNKRAQHRELAEQMGIHFPGLLEEGFIFSYQVNAQVEEIRFKPEQLVLNAFHTYWLIFGSLCLHEVEVGRFMETEWGEFVAKELSKEKIEAMVKAYNMQLEDISNHGWHNIDNKIGIEAGKVSFSLWVKHINIVDENDTSLPQCSFKAFARQYLLTEQSIKAIEIQNKALAGNVSGIARMLCIMAADQMSIGLNFQFMNLHKINVIGFQAGDINLAGTDLSDANLWNAGIVRGDFSNANLSNASLATANLASANLINSNLITAFLSSAYLNSANLSNATLIGAILTNANLSHANLYGANFHNAELSDSYVKGANLGNAYLVNANLGYANLEKVNFENANLMNANLINANFENATLINVNLVNAKVANVNWLKNLKNIGVKGATVIEKKYKVNPKKQKFNDRFRGSIEGYVIEVRKVRNNKE